MKRLVSEPLDYVKKMLASQLSELLNPFHGKVPIMYGMILDTPIHCKAMAEKPQQDGSMPPDVNTSLVTHGHGTHILPLSEQDASMMGQSKYSLDYS